MARPKLILIALLALIIATVTACSSGLFGPPAGPGGSFDDRQQKAFAAAAVVSIGLCTDLSHRLKPEELAQAAAGARLVQTTLGGAISPEQAEMDLRALMGADAQMTGTIASIVYAVGAFMPQEFKASVGLALLKVAASNCADIFASAPA